TGDGRRLTLTIVNRDVANTVQTSVEIEHLPAPFKRVLLKKIAYTAENLYAVNTFENENSVKTTEKSEKITGNKINISLPPASFNVIVLEAQDGIQKKRK
ncbi:MAG: hypothetical protein MUP99_02480, partial [Pedobacter sp.]|nr:hypothetical protein [Pedobacter sp.]